MTDRDVSVRRAETWIQGYRRAWTTNDPDQIRALFTDDAEYRDGPDSDPWVGADEIVTRWLDQLDEPGTWSFEHRLVAVDGDTAVVRGLTRYPQATDKAAVYHNLMVLELTADGRAARFTDWFVAAESTAEQPSGSNAARNSPLG